jgi:hypothetical protein
VERGPSSPPATSSFTGRWKAGSKRLMPARASLSGNSKPVPGSSVNRSPIAAPTDANISRYCRGWGLGRRYCRRQSRPQGPDRCVGVCRRGPRSEAKDDARRDALCLCLAAIVVAAARVSWASPLWRCQPPPLSTAAAQAQTAGSLPADEGGPQNVAVTSFFRRRFAPARRSPCPDLSRQRTAHQRRASAFQLVQLLRMPLQRPRRHRASADGHSMALWRTPRPDLCLDRARPSERHAVMERQDPRCADLGTCRFCSLAVCPDPGERRSDRPTPPPAPRTKHRGSRNEIDGSDDRPASSRCSAGAGARTTGCVPILTTCRSRTTRARDSRTRS